jgi:hypothetical protein
VKREVENKGHRCIMNSCTCWLNLFADPLRFLILGLRSKTSLAAENLFLRQIEARSTLAGETLILTDRKRKVG